jgi:hypothetical protein
MNFQFYFEKLLESKDFKKFSKENKDAFLCSGFFIVDKKNDENKQKIIVMDKKRAGTPVNPIEKGEENKQSIDYFVPSLKKMYSFKISNEVEMIPVENFGEVFKPEKIPDNVNFDFKEIEDLIQKKMEEEKIKNKIEKLLLSLQAKDKINYILGTIFISSLGLIKVRIDLNEKKIVDFEKMSFFDMMKVVKKGDKL